MAAYATTDEIRESSPNIPAIQRGTDEDILRWAHEAFVTINAHCRMSFAFEQQATRLVQLGAYSDVYLPQVMSGEILVSRALAGQSAIAVDSRYIEFTPNTFTLRYNGLHPSGMAVTPSTLHVRADWGFAPSRAYLLIAAANDLKARYNLHRVSLTSHLAADTNGVIEGDATSLSTAMTLLNGIKAALNLHVVNATAHTVAATVLITEVNATNELTAVALAVALKTFYNTHVRSTSQHLAVDPLTTGLSVTNMLLPDEIRLAFTKVVGRVAIRDNAEDIRYLNAGFDTESFSDGYSYRVSEARAHLIMPSDMALLSEWVNEGRVVY